MYDTFSCAALSRMRLMVPDNIHCPTEQTLSVVRNGRHACCVTQQTCLLCDTTDMSAV